jgi:hypothetical protein
VSAGEIVWMIAVMVSGLVVWLIVSLGFQKVLPCVKNFKNDRYKSWYIYSLIYNPQNSSKNCLAFQICKLIKTNASKNSTNGIKL